MSRYIDTEELKHIVNNSKYYGTERQIDFCDMIAETPTADVEPVRHGRWLDSEIGGAKICSLCHSHIGLSGFDYCPRCGARMDGDKDE